MTKLEARAYQKKRIMEIQSRDDLEKRIQENLLERLQFSKKVIGYRSDKWEVDLDPVWKNRAFQIVEFYFPRVVSKDERILEFVCPDSWTVGAYGLFEPIGTKVLAPENADLAIIPALGFQSNGFRLGRGAGFYDRAFLGIESKKMLGIGFSELFSIDFPPTDYDIRVGEIVTENKIIFF